MFGHGDGGGGPSVSHLEKLTRLKNCPGLPVLRLDSTPEKFFDDVAADREKFLGNGLPPPRWSGELYLELHQGTLTSQAKIKKQNRKCESLLRGCDALFVQYVLNGGDSTVTLDNKSWTMQDIKCELKALWKDLLLNQFHDVIRKYIS